MASPGRTLEGRAHQPGTPPTTPLRKVTPDGGGTWLMISSNGPRADVPCRRPLFGATIARIPAMAALSSGVTGCVSDQEVLLGMTCSFIFY